MRCFSNRSGHAPLILIAGLICFTVSCVSPPDDTHVREAGTHTVRILVLGGYPEPELETGSHFRQSWNLGAETSVRSEMPVAAEATAWDLIDLSSEFVRSSGASIRDIEIFCRKAADSGALVFLEADVPLHNMQDLAGLSDVSPNEPTLVIPIFSPFPPLLQHLESILRTASIESPTGDRTTYEQTHLPSFVDTTEQECRWIRGFTARADSAQTLVADPRGNPLMTFRRIGRGAVVWIADFSRKTVPFHGVETIRDFRLGFPDPEATNFHYGAAGLDYLFRDRLVDLSAKLKYGYSIRRVPGPNGAPCCAFQNHLDAYDNWTAQYAIRWSRILLERGLIPSFTVRSDLTQFDRPEMAGSSNGARDVADYCRQRGIPLNLHLTFEPTDSRETELDRIDRDLANLEAIGIARTDITGCDHHVFYTHASPVWQSYHSLLERGLFHDFGGETLSCFDLFPYAFCTSSAYAPYSPPFLLEDAAGRLLPLVVGSPLPARPLFSSYLNRTGFPAALGMPVLQYFHPEFIHEADRFDQLDPEFQTMIQSLEWLRDVSGYVPLTEPQVARSIIAARTAPVRAYLQGERIIRFHVDSSVAMAQAGSFRSALGVRIEVSPERAGGVHWTTDAHVRRLDPHDGAFEIGLRPDGDTTVRMNGGQMDGFHIERINLPYEWVDHEDGAEIIVSEPGLRWIRLPCDPGASEGWLPETFSGTVVRRARAIDFYQTGREPLRMTFRKFSGAGFDRLLCRLIHTRADVEPVMELDFGMPEVRSMLREGWCIIDEISEGRSVTWASGGLKSEIEVPLQNASSIRAELDVNPYSIGKRTQQTMTVRVNEWVVCETITLKPGWQRVAFDIPSHALIHGLNRIEFAYGYTGCPGLDLPHTNDFRLLAVMFDRLRFSLAGPKGIAP